MPNTTHTTGNHTGAETLDADDIADVVVAALTGDGHAGATYELTGPRLLTFADAAAEIATAAGAWDLARPNT